MPALPLDGGPIYAETRLDRVIAEPLNAATALLFLGVAAWIAWRIRSRWREIPFLAACVPVLAVGGVGGTLFHATRASRWFLALDVVPILLLCVGVAVILWLRVLPSGWWLAAVLPPFFLVQRFGFRFLERSLGIQLSYATLGAMVVVPAALVLVRTRFSGAWYLGGALASFALALAMRGLDREAILSTGTHFLWHTFGALASLLLAEWLLRLPSGRAPGPIPSAPPRC